MICKIFRIFSRSGDRELQGPVSRRRGDCGGQAPALRGRNSLSVGGDRQILTCSRSGDRELQGPWPLFCSAGSPDPARTAKQNPAKSWKSWKSCCGFRSVRTLMSIDTQLSHGEKVHRTLMSIDSEGNYSGRISFLFLTPFPFQFIIIYRCRTNR